jgi:hypothetical protein
MKLKMPHVITMASALLLAAGCAHEEHQAQYNENVSPGYSSGRLNGYGDAGNGSASSRTDSTSYSAGVSGSAEAGRTDSRSDNTVVSAVRESLQQDAEIAPIVPNIQITANNGAVVLNGSVQSEEQKRQIEAIVQRTTGVVAVNNQLQIISSPGSRESNGQNQPNNGQLNPTSRSNENQKNYQENGGQQMNQGENSSLSSSNSAPGLDQKGGGGLENSSSNSLNQTSRPNGNEKIYQESGTQTNEDQKLDATSNSNSPARIYHNAGSSQENSSSNALNATSRENGATRNYEQTNQLQNGQEQSTNNNQMP